MEDNKEPLQGVGTAQDIMVALAEIILDKTASSRGILKSAKLLAKAVINQSKSNT